MDASAQPATPRQQVAAMTTGDQLAFATTLMRGGTSRGLFFRAEVLPEDSAARDRVVLRAMGGGDPFGRQIDGLGGATSSTSKVVVVGPSRRPGFDVDYLFGQVGIRFPIVDWTGTCGNLAAAVGPFAIDEGLVSVAGDSAVLRIWQAGLERAIVAHVPLADGVAAVDGTLTVDGVPHPGAEIRLDFLDPGGALGSGLLPTGNPVASMEVAGVGSVPVSIVDAGMPVAFVSADDVGVDLSIPGDPNADPALVERVRRVRAAAAAAIGTAQPDAEPGTVPARPLLGLVGLPSESVGRGWRGAAAADLAVQFVSMDRFHAAIPGTGAIATAIAALLPGTIPATLARRAETAGRLRIKHPSGSIDVEAEVELVASAWVARRATIWRTARRLMSGVVYVPRSAAST